MKALNDPNRNVRLKAGIALGHLITIHMRPDPLFNEIFNGIKGADDASTRDTYIQVQFILNTQSPLASIGSETYFCCWDNILECHRS